MVTGLSEAQDKHAILIKSFICLKKCCFFTVVEDETQTDTCRDQRPHFPS